MARARTICTEPGCPHTSADRGRCAVHQSERDRRQQATVPTKRTRDWAERRRRAAAVRRWVETHGWWCPGYGREAHEVDDGDLTAEHIRAIADGGAPGGRLAVLCRPCNSRHGAETANRWR